jgi:Na+-driven multidrug efflux pump
MIYVNFINGVGKIKLQLYTSIITMIINIPLSIFFGKYLGWGPAGVVLATCCSLIYAVILRPIQYFKIINNTAKGIWNK